MKKRLLAKIKVEKAKRVRRRAHHHPPSTVKDPKDLRGAKGALRKSAVEAAMQDESFPGETAEPRHPAIRIRSDW